MTSRIFRSLWRDKQVVGAAILCLALGVATQAVVLELANQLLLRAPAGLEDTSNLRRLFFTTQRDGTEGHSSFSYPVFQAMETTGAFDTLSAYVQTEVTYRTGEAPYKSPAVLAGRDFFSTLGLTAHRGRLFTADEARPGTLPAVAVVTTALANRLFGSSAAALGQDLTISAQPFEIVGVLPPNFTGTESAPTELYLPIGALQILGFSPGWEENPNAWTLQVLGRLPSGSDEAVAAERLFAAAQPFNDAGVRVTLAPIQPARGPGSPLPKLLYGLAIVTAVVLLIAVLNVVSLFVVRHLRRSREIGIRTALGATRRNLLKMLGAEALVVGGVAAVLAVGLAAVELVVLRNGLLATDIDWSTLPVGRITLWVVGLLLLITPLSAVVPALRIRQADIAARLSGTGASSGRRRRRLEGLVMVVQVSLAAVAVVAVGWFLASLHEISTLDLGLEPERVLVTTVDTGAMTSDQVKALYDDMSQRVATLPGIDGTAVAAGIPLASSFGLSVSLPDGEAPKLPTGGPYFNAVSEDFFSVLGTRVVRGRGIEAGDLGAGSPPIVVVNETMARLYWPESDPIGQCLGVDKQPCARVVGIVADAQRFGLEKEPTFQLYVPLTQGPTWISGRALFARPKSGDIEEAANSVRQALLPMANGGWVEVRQLSTFLDRHTRPYELGTTLAGVAALLALLLISLGLYATASRHVTERRRELGVRMALGAGRGRVLGGVFLGLLKYLLPGLVLGLVAAVFLGRWAEPLLFDVTTKDPLILGAAALVLVWIAALATWFPARRAARTAPSTALRS